MDCHTEKHEKRKFGQSEGILIARCTGSRPNRRYWPSDSQLAAREL